MIVYKKNKLEFLDDVSNGLIEDIIEAQVLKVWGSKTQESLYRSWQHSLQHMYFVLDSELVPFDVSISIEYMIPGTMSRIDFMVAGQDADGNDHIVLIELKQWSSVRATKKDAIISWSRGKNQIQDTHPSYQAWSYAALLEGFNTEVYENKIGVSPCAYLHNLLDDGIISGSFYADHLAKAPSFFKTEKIKVRNFISERIKQGDKTDIIQRVDSAKVRPSKKLADELAKLLKGNDSFVMIDAQKIALENALSNVTSTSDSRKKVMIIMGGPGTGKSVVAIHLLSKLSKKGINARYVTRNAAPRSVYEKKLTKVMTKTRFAHLFKGSSSFVASQNNEFDALIVDEAHRLMAGSGRFIKGENQVKEIIHASRSSVFFLDEDQQVTMFDIGDQQEIEKWAQHFNAEVSYMELTSQFRCGGSEGYLAWLNNVLQIRESANLKISELKYDFKVVDDPNLLRALILEKNRERDSARMVAGYCWDWLSLKDPQAMDVVIAEHGFQMQWNLRRDGYSWIIEPGSVEQVGCIHTCQGLEVDYIGVIVGDDLLYRDGKLVVNPYAHPQRDRALSGYKGLMKTDPVSTMERLDRIIKNTYRTLMSRGMKGCYIYCTDKETQAYFKRALSRFEKH